MPNQRDVVLIPIPFTDLSSQKRRPVIVISGDHYNQNSLDVVVVALTSNPQTGEYAFSITSADLEHGTLHRPSTVRADKIYTLAQSIIVKTFGRVNVATLDRIRELLGDLVTTDL